MAVEAGTRLGRYVVHEYVGQGTLGTVYRAAGGEHGTVVVKVLHRLSEPESRERFREVAPRLAQLRHPNLVAVLEHGEHHGVPYLVEAHVDGVTLAERFRRATMTPAAAIDVLRGAGAGLDHAHAAGLVHGNLKPAQVLLAAGGPVVSDLALAPLRRPRLAGLAVGFRDGTPEYLAPEQVVGGEPTPATDRYAFAAIAYQLLVDRPPFEGEPQAVMNAHLRAGPPAPSRRNRALPPAVDAALLRALAKDQAGRWPTCAALVDELAGALGLRQEPRPAAPPPARHSRRWAHALAGCALVAVAGMAAGLAVAGQARRSAVPVGMSVSRVSVHAGETVTVSADHLPANQPGTVQSGPASLGQFRADGSGNARTSVRIPADASPGSHLVRLCWRDACPAAVSLMVERGPAPSPSPSPAPAPSPRPGATASATPASTPRQARSPSPGPSATPLARASSNSTATPTTAP